MTDIQHDPGRGAPLAVVSFRDAYKYRINKERMLAVEGLHTGQFVYCGKRGRQHGSRAVYENSRVK